MNSTIIIWGSNEQVQQSLSKITQLYDNQLVFVQTSSDNLTYIALYCSFEFIDYRYIKEIINMKENIISNMKQVKHRPQQIPQAVFDSLQLNLQEISNIQLFNSNMRNILKFKVGPVMIMNFFNSQWRDQYIVTIQQKTTKFYYRMADSQQNFYLSLLVNREIQDSLYITKRQLIPKGQCKRHGFDVPTIMVPKFMSVSTYVKLVFDQHENEELAKIAELEKQQRNTKVQPLMIVRFDNTDAAIEAQCTLGDMFNEQNLKIKVVKESESTYFGMVFNLDFITVHSIWNSIPKGSNRFYQKSKSYQIPSFITQDIFDKIMFTQKEVDDISTSEYIQQPRCQQAVPPRMIVMVERDSVQEVEKQLHDKLEGSFIQTRYYVTKFGSAFIGILFQEPLCKPETIKNFLSKYQYQCAESTLDQCPLFVPPQVYQELFFSIGFYRGLQLQAQTLDQSYQKEQKTVIKEQLEKRKRQEIQIYKDNIILMDFEAFLVKHEIVLPSEIGVIRIINNQPVAALHALLKSKCSQVDEIQNYNKILRVQQLTGLPYFDDTKYNGFERCGDFKQLGELLKSFCTMSSQELLQLAHDNANIQITIFQQFAENSKYQIMSKGTRLESVILSDLLTIKDKVVEFCDYLQQEFSLEKIYLKKYFANSHSAKRQYCYCKFHQSIKKKIGLNGQMIHCAFDDVNYLTNVIKQIVNKDNLDVQQDVVESSENSEDKQQNYISLVINVQNDEMGKQYQSQIKKYYQDSIVTNIIQNGLQLSFNPNKFGILGILSLFEDVEFDLNGKRRESRLQIQILNNTDE